MPNDAILAIENLSVRLPSSGERRYAVRNISLKIKPREILCVVGESGSGKSVTAFTSMGLLPKVLKPESGSIKLKGQELMHLSERELQDIRGSKIGMVFQEPMTSLNPSFSVGHQISEMFIRHRAEMGKGERTEKVLNLLRLVKLPNPESLVNAYPRQLSGGQRQRVMIAMALALSPQLLIADEPTTALDVTTQARILDLFQELRERHNAGILFITHDFGVVSEIANRVVVMEKGVMVEEGDTRQILNDPQHPYTQKLIAAIPRMRSHKVASQPAPATRPVLSIQQMSKTFQTRHGMFGKKRTVEALKGATLVLNRGESIAVVGESGSGKSTLVSCMMRLITADSGTMALDGVDYFSLSGNQLHKHRRDIQIIFQDPYSSLNPRKSVKDILLQGSRNYGIAEELALEKARELLKTVRLDDNALNRYPHQFSGGQRQRICIARALMLEPKVLIADEAVSALDVSIQAEVLKLLREIQEQMQLTLIFVTHDLRVASQLCERVLVMNKGEIVERGSIVDVFKAPTHPYTKVLLDAMPGRGWAAV